MPPAPHLITFYVCLMEHLRSISLAILILMKNPKELKYNIKNLFLIYKIKMKILNSLPSFNSFLLVQLHR